MALIIDYMKLGTFTWKKEVEAFMEIKRCLSIALMLVLPYFNISFELHVNTSKIGTKVVLRKEVDW